MIHGKLARCIRQAISHVLPHDQRTHWYIYHNVGVHLTIASMVYVHNVSWHMWLNIYWSEYNWTWYYYIIWGMCLYYNLYYEYSLSSGKLHNIQMYLQICTS